MGDSSFSLILHFNNTIDEVIEEKEDIVDIVDIVKESINDFCEEVIIDKSKKILCDICGGSYTYYTKNTHIKTIKHMKKL
jgi:hypothetical protein